MNTTKHLAGHILTIAFAMLILGRAAWAIPPDFDRNRTIIKPSLVSMAPGGEQRFKAIMMATYLKAASAPEKVIWSVNGVPGGSAEFGTIDANGIYTAPRKTPTPHEVHIGAEVPEAANRYLWATALVGTVEQSYEFVTSWSEPVPPKDAPAPADAKKTNLKSPHGIALDADGNILIADQDKSRVLRFTTEGKYLGDIGLGKGGDPGEFTEPRVVTIDAQGLIWATDSKGDRPRIQVFTREGKFIRIFAEKGILPGQILRAHGMGFDSQQRLFTVDVDNFRINCYTHAGEFLYSWGEPGLSLGQFNAPHGLFVDPSGDIFISGYYGPTQKFDAKGNFLLTFGHGDPPDGPVYFHTAVGDKWGNVYLMVRNKEGGQGEIQKSDAARQLSIMKYNNNGDYVTGWSLAERDHKESWAVVADDGTVYSLFKGETQVGVQVFVPK